MTLLNAIPYGRENAVSRAELASLTGLRDRAIRKEIKELNAEITKHGEAILSSSSGKGYWRTANVAEMKQYLRESRHRQQKQLQNDAPIQKLVYDAEGVTVIHVKAHCRRLRSKENLEGQVTFE